MSRRDTRPAAAGELLREGEEGAGKSLVSATAENLFMSSLGCTVQPLPSVGPDPSLAGLVRAYRVGSFAVANGS